MEETFEALAVFVQGGQPGQRQYLRLARAILDQGTRLHAEQGDGLLYSRARMGLVRETSTRIIQLQRS